MKNKLFTRCLAYIICAFCTCVMIRQLILTEHRPSYGVEERVLKIVIDK